MRSTRREPWRPLAMMGAVVLAGACSSSSSTPTNPGGGTPTPHHGTSADALAYAANTSGGWTLFFGQIASYLIITGQSVTSRGALGGPAPGPRISPRLLNDTIVISDSIKGPIVGTDLDQANYLVYDDSGAIWVSLAGPSGDGAIVKYSRAQQSTGGMQTPYVVIRGLSAPEGLAFDVSGNLWVVDGSADQLNEFSTTQLLTGGTLTPATSISLAGLTTAGATWTPMGLAIDGHGNFWISAQLATPPLGSAADSTPAYVVAEFPPATADTGNPPPAIVLFTRGVHPAGYGPGVTFDASGNLWTTNAAGASVTEFTAGSLTGGGADVLPALTVTGSALTGTSDIKFDGNGVLFVGGSVNQGGGSLYAYPPSAVAASGAPTPKLTYAPSSGVNHFAVR